MNFRKKAKARLKEQQNRHLATLKRVSSQQPKAYVLGFSDGFNVEDGNWENTRGFTGRTKVFYLRGVRNGLNTRHAFDNEEEHQWK